MSTTSPSPETIGGLEHALDPSTTVLWAGGGIFIIGLIWSLAAAAHHAHAHDHDWL